MPRLAVHRNVRNETILQRDKRRLYGVWTDYKKQKESANERTRGTLGCRLSRDGESRDRGSVLGDRAVCWRTRTVRQRTLLKIVTSTYRTYVVRKGVL